MQKSEMRTLNKSLPDKRCYAKHQVLSSHWNSFFPAKKVTVNFLFYTKKENINKKQYIIHVKLTINCSENHT